MVRLQFSVRDYLPVEIFGADPNAVMVRLRDVLGELATTRGWTPIDIENELDRVKPDWFDTIVDGLTFVDLEMYA